MNKVYLVGAGTGRGMLTLRGAELLKNCSCVVYDSLLREELLSLCPPDCARIFVGKRAGEHSAGQSEINRILVECGKKYPVTVRLKGGDPFVFGRGGEELLALRSAGIACEAVPGVTSAVAAAELAGIPVTHRGAARGFTVLAAHSAEGAPDFSRYAQAEETLVFLMAKAAAGNIMRGLLAGGMAADTPAALLSAAGSENSVCVQCPLCELEERAASLPAPLTIVVGRVCSPALFPAMSGAENSDTFVKNCVESAPENGAELCEGGAAKRSTEKCAAGSLRRAKICVTGTPAHVSRVFGILRERGVLAENCAFLLPIPLDLSDFFAKMQNYEWLVFTSENGVRLFFEQVREKGIDLRAFGGKKFAAVGPHTAQTLQSFGFIPDLMPEVYTADALASALAARGAKRDSTALLRAKQGAGKLSEAGEQFSVYELSPDPALLERAAECASAADVVTFGSAFGAKCLLEKCALREGAAAVCIGEETAKELRLRGCAPAVCGSARAEELAEAAERAAKERT